MNKMNTTNTDQFQSYEDAVNWVTNLVSFGIRPGLKRMDMMMEMLGSPHRRLKFIHVAGTNGKGSTCAYISKVLTDSGYEVGMFTSPYIESFTNRININGQNISEEHMLQLINTIKPVVDEVAESELGQPSMFEVVTTMSLLYFAKISFPDFVVWETGLGGRLDCTNIVHPLVSVITNVGHDHMDILGDTLDQIAAEKAGIIKPGVPVVSTVDQPEVIEVIKQKAEQNKSTLYLLGEQFNYRSIASDDERQRLYFEGPFATFENVPVSLNGAHQLKNAAAAIMTLEVLRQYYAALVDEEFIVSGIGETVWPGRLEMISKSPRILLDGAHNPEGAASLAESLKHTYSHQRIHFMMGMLQSKKHEAYLRHILPLVHTLIITEPDYGRKMEAEQLRDIALRLLEESGRQGEVTVMTEPSWKVALQKLEQVTEPDDLAVISGTLYLISDVRTWILHEKDSEKGW